MLSFLLSYALANQSNNFDDRDVIEKVLLSNARLVYPNSSPKGFVVLRPSYQRTRPGNILARRPYDDWLKELISNSKEDLGQLKGGKYKKERQHLLAQLSLLRTLSGMEKGGNLYLPEPILPLKSFEWNQCIVLSEKGGRWWNSKNELDPRVAHSSFFCTVAAPTFSLDGTNCIVGYSFPWGMHSGSGVDILQRTNDGWKIIYEKVVYYP